MFDLAYIVQLAENFSANGWRSEEGGRRRIKRRERDRADSNKELPGVILLSERGYSAIAIISHSALESGWGESRLAKEYNNYFGIKGRGVTLPTREFYEGRFVGVDSGFAVFKSVIECFLYYDALISSKFKQAFERRYSPNEYFLALQQSGYATDPDYRGKLMLVMETIKSVLREG